MDYDKSPREGRVFCTRAWEQSKILLKRLSFLGGGLIAVVLVFGLFVYPTYASIGSFFDELFVRDVSGETTPPSKNSQTIPLLTASFNVNPTISYRADITVSEDGTLSADNGPIGDRVEVSPVSSHDQISVYVVRDGDSLAQIAQMFDVSKETIIWANDLSGNKIKPGQILTILPVSGIIHIVKKGDTLSSIAKKYKIDVENVAGFNDLSDGAVLIAGDELIIPNGKLQQMVPSTPMRTSSPKVYKQVTAGYYQSPLASYRRTQGFHGNNGVDLAAPIGSPIYASASGKVIISTTGGWNGGYGVYVVISHPNGTQTLYAHNKENVVNVGDQVKQGDIISSIGLSGRTTGPHVHFEVRGAKNPF